MVSYSYDSYGNILSIDGTLSSTIGEINPFVYRGYYYDHETNLYFITSQYYLPEIGRFIQYSDISNLNLNSINGLNLYSYASNNPIRNMYSSSIGSFIDQLIIPKIEDINNINKFNIQWENKWLAIGEPSFLVLKRKSFEIINCDFSIYKGNLYFDDEKNNSVYVGVGNVSVFAGYNAKKNKYGVFLDANVLSVGYDGRYIDVGISIIGIGIIFGWEDNRLRIKFDPFGCFGIDITIDFGKVIEDYEKIYGGGRVNYV